MSKILYLFGAGASAQAMPLIKSNQSVQNKGLPQELNWLVQEFPKVSHDISSSTLEMLKTIAWNSMEFGTPDLFAKFLLETGDSKNYNLLKKLISYYFTIVQSPKPAFQGWKYGLFDKRALAFLTMIAGDRKVPESVKILSWNYDSQMEIAAEKLKNIRGFTCYPNTMDGDGILNDQTDSFLLHINGIAGYRYDKLRFIGKQDKIKFDDEKEETFLSFAWEDETNDEKRSFHEKRLQKIQRIASESEILVVIGYSFPFFNRKIDASIFNVLRNSMTKIYIQDTKDRVSEVCDLVKSNFPLNDIAKGNIIPVNQVDNYHIPYEL